MQELQRSVFPAYAGVILILYKLTCQEVRIPRVCGGDPYLKRLESLPEAYSPRMRG